ncbi:helix-turn-helix transcriptional regulator [Bacillus cereus group sp. BfR-BA-01538]|uniref:helix-turn-helix transcriptional regulator n=1 Tax=Bacillus cereus group sp. BfR-BA-01538 TaxID=2920373 RepID=UPI001F56F38F
MKNQIKQLRTQHNITQIQMAKDLQVTRQIIVAIENNHYNPSLELVLKLSRYFNTRLVS